MEAVILIAPHEYWETITTRLSGAWHLSKRSDGGWMIEEGTSRLHVYAIPDGLAEFDSNVRAKIDAHVTNPIVYAVDFTDIDLCRRVLHCIADDQSILVDNDHGLMATGREFVNLLRQRPDWDWTSDSLPS